jgi:hypothetical protein
MATRSLPEEMAVLAQRTDSLFRARTKGDLALWVKNEASPWRWTVFFRFHLAMDTLAFRAATGADVTGDVYIQF